MKRQNSFIMTCTIGLLLFSMFFGSGNLIFPPYLGYEAADMTLPALLGFIVTAVVFPVLGVIAIAKNNDLLSLAGHAGRKFALVFSIIVFLALGPGLAIPRNAAVSFEMAVVSFREEITIGVRIAYSVIFFVVSWLLSVHAEKLVDWLGKILAPVLLVLMVVLSIYCIVKIPSVSMEPSSLYAEHAGIQGFLDGYNTMDTLAALNFDNIIAINVMGKGIMDKNQVVRYTMKSGVIAGILLALVYAVLAYAGKTCAGLYEGAENGASVLAFLVEHVLGRSGVILLAVIYVLSCLTTCVGLLCSCAEFFASITRLSYKAWITLFAIAGCVFSVAGLNGLLKFSVPFLNAIYPAAMVLVMLGLFSHWLEKHPLVWPSAIFCTGIVSCVHALASCNVVIPGVTKFLLSFPPAKELCWLLPCIFGIIIGRLLPQRKCSAGKDDARIPA